MESLEFGGEFFGTKHSQDLVSLNKNIFLPTSKFPLNLSAYFLENKDKG